LCRSRSVPSWFGWFLWGKLRIDGFIGLVWFIRLIWLASDAACPAITRLQRFTWFIRFQWGIVLLLWFRRILWRFVRLLWLRWIERIER